MQKVFWSIVCAILTSVGAFGAAYYGFELPVQDAMAATIVVDVIALVLATAFFVTYMGDFVTTESWVAILIVGFLVAFMSAVTTCFFGFGFVAALIAALIIEVVVVLVAYVVAKAEDLSYWLVFVAYTVEGAGQRASLYLLPSSPWMAALAVVATIIVVAVICFVSVRYCSVPDQNSTEISSSQCAH